MKRKTSVRRAPKSAATSRDVLLAGIGAVSLGRKQVIKSYTDAVSSVYSLRDQANAAVNAAGAKAVRLRKQAQARIAPARKTVVTLVSGLRSQAQAQLQPVLGKLGLAATKARVSRKPAAAKRAPAKAVKRSRKAA